MEVERDGLSPTDKVAVVEALRPIGPRLRSTSANPVLRTLPVVVEITRISKTPYRNVRTSGRVAHHGVGNRWKRTPRRLLRAVRTRVRGTVDVHQVSVRVGTLTVDPAGRVRLHFPS